MKGRGSWPLIIVLALVLAGKAGSAAATAEGNNDIIKIRLQSYEANRVGWTFDSNDVGYLDFTVSLKYPFASPDYVEEAKTRVNSAESLVGSLARTLGSPVPYLAFTGRFGQYLETRDSSPVVGKRFNPKFILRFFTAGSVNSYVDLGYAHESNGQTINSGEAYQELRNDYSRDGQDPDFANDSISRGWDYWEAAWYRNFNENGDEAGEGLSTYLSLKYFLEDGYLQGEAEQYNSWENDSNGKPRKEVDGLTAKIIYQRSSYLGKFWKITLEGGGTLIYTTGYKNAFRYNTLRGEVMVRIGSLPLVLWISEGYNSDLVDYYRRVRSSGICLTLESFGNP